ncbi:DUF5906 domain-containing protein [Deinococcus sp. Leaf326]|uniref:DUF5906 domain-containing protein n=1 Tax=Deinococcus sp. Leaf326 TaxID=1736338 RepID=UPI0006F6F88D|nr:DUF5906 domain-containing protein [Deinococcus sp. Leaf326]KQR04691.1 hypothetical protein ASF71_11775 [Deinococcus sp. Leaf326]
MTSTLPVLSNEWTEKLIAEGGTSKAPPPSIGEAKQTPEPRQNDGGGLIDWYNAQMPLVQDLLRRGYKDEGNGRMSSPYSETGRDVTLLPNKKGFLCAYLHSSSHPMAQWMGLAGEALSDHLIDPVEFFVYYEHSNGGKVPYGEARQAALRSIAKEREMAALSKKVGDIELPDASQIPAPEDLIKGKPHYSDAQMLALLGYPPELGSLFGDLPNGYRTAQSSDGDLRYGETSGLYWVYSPEKIIWAKAKEDKPQVLAYASKLPLLLEQESEYIVRCAVALEKAGRVEDSEAMLRQIGSYRKAKEQVARHVVRRSALADARPSILIRDELFNLQDDVLPFPNILDYRGTLRERRREDYITDILPVEYHPNANRSDFYEVIDYMTGYDRNLRDDIQYMVGYTLRGSNDQRIIPNFWGPPGTGKSIIANSLAATLGNLAVALDPKHISTKSDHERAGQVFRGKRLALVNEVGGTARLQSEFLKAVSGGDLLTARALYAESETFRATHTTLIISNEPINVDTTDDALWERIKIFPFLHRLAPEGREALLGGKRLQDVIRDPESAYLRGFLAWAMEGLERVRGGELFRPSETVARASIQGRNDSDRYRDFWLTHDFDESIGGMPVLQRLREGVTANWLMFQLHEWCPANGVPIPKGPALKRVYEAVGLVKRTSAKKWFLEYPERFPQ